MARSIFVVQGNAEPGRDGDYNEWYSNTHIPEVLALPGFATAQRFRLARIPGDPGSASYAYEYLTIYEVDCPPEEANAILEEAKSGPSQWSPTDTSSPVRSSAFFTELGPQIVANGHRRGASDSAS